MDSHRSAGQSGYEDLNGCSGQLQGVGLVLLSWGGSASLALMYMGTTSDVNNYPGGALSLPFHLTSKDPLAKASHSAKTSQEERYTAHGHKEQ